MGKITIFRIDFVNFLGMMYIVGWSQGPDSMQSEQRS